VVGRRLTGLSRQDGFTLPELVIVVVIISILSTIALPVFLNQNMRGQDSAAKSDARNLSGQVQQCHEGKSVPDYTSCDTLAELTAENGPLSVPYGSDPGEVEIEAATTDTFRVLARSRSGNQFAIELTSGGGMVRDCTAENSAGCPPGGHW
jgi:type IV pilus assembly protein PilA